MDELVALRIDLVESFTVTLRENEMTCFAIARLDRLLAISTHMFPIVTTEAAIPVLMPDKIRMAPPIRVHFREEILAIDLLDNIRYLRNLWRIFVSLAERIGDALFGFSFCLVRLDERCDGF